MSNTLSIQVIKELIKGKQMGIVKVEVEAICFRKYNVLWVYWKVIDAPKEHEE
jgi:hypothetical protein